MIAHVVGLRESLGDWHKEQESEGRVAAPSAAWTATSAKFRDLLGDQVREMEQTTVEMVQDALVASRAHGKEAGGLTLAQLVPDAALRRQLLVLREGLVREYTRHLDGLSAVHRQLAQGVAVREERQRDAFDQSTEQSLFVMLKDMERIQDESSKLGAKIGVLQEMHVSWLMEREYTTPLMARGNSGTGSYAPKSTGNASSVAPVSAFSREDVQSSNLASSMPPGARFEYVRTDDHVVASVQEGVEEDIVRFDIREHVASTIKEHSTPASPQKQHFSSPVACGLSNMQHSVSPQKLPSSLMCNATMRGPSASSPLRMPPTTSSVQSSPLKNPPVSPYLTPEDAGALSRYPHKSLQPALALAFYQDVLDHQRAHPKKTARTPQHRRRLTTTPASARARSRRTLAENQTGGVILSKIFSPRAEAHDMFATAAVINEEIAERFSSRCLFPDASNVRVLEAARNTAGPALVASPLPKVSFQHARVNSSASLVDLTSGSCASRTPVRMGLFSPAKQLIMSRRPALAPMQGNTSHTHTHADSDSDADSVSHSKVRVDSIVSVQDELIDMFEGGDLDVTVKDQTTNALPLAVQEFDTSRAAAMVFSPPMPEQKACTKTPFTTPAVTAQQQHREQQQQRTPESKPRVSGMGEQYGSSSGISPFRLGSAARDRVARPLLVLSPAMYKDRKPVRQPDELGRSLELDLSMIDQDETVEGSDTDEGCDVTVTRSIADELDTTVERVRAPERRAVLASASIMSPVMGEVHPGTFLDRMTHDDQHNTNHFGLGDSIRLARRQNITQ